ncbi:MIP/aquaporin family protein [Paenibacillus tarimensis]|uniref:MIP/aquaporin family protein n=1 Tax=Paenibacillus tarimensis TaxID=416012 RepID=UPI001F293A69|nr:aquaporin [Paenibacillus tarimensis]MCF2945279.1 aquaporin [Paenibacillus tarimensis]
MGATELKRELPVLVYEAERGQEPLSMLRKKWIAEFIGSYFLVFAGTGAVIVNTLTSSLTHIGVAITFGLVVMALIYAFGHVSGAHFNPAVTLAFLFLRQIDARTALSFVVTQCLGALAASLTLLSMFGHVGSLGATLPSGSWQQSAVMEFILTFALMLVILASAVHAKASKSFAGIAIGGTVALEAMFAGPVSGASMNPARSLGPAIVSGSLSHLWLYIVCTTAGAVLAAYVYNQLHE